MAVIFDDLLVVRMHKLRAWDRWKSVAKQRLVVLNHWINNL